MAAWRGCWPMSWRCRQDVNCSITAPGMRRKCATLLRSSRVWSTITNPWPDSSLLLWGCEAGIAARPSDLAGIAAGQRQTRAAVAGVAQLVFQMPDALPGFDGGGAGYGPADGGACNVACAAVCDVFCHAASGGFLCPFIIAVSNPSRNCEYEK